LFEHVRPREKEKTQVASITAIYYKEFA